MYLTYKLQDQGFTQKYGSIAKESYTHATFYTRIPGNGGHLIVYECLRIEQF